MQISLPSRSFGFLGIPALRESAFRTIHDGQGWEDTLQCIEHVHALADIVCRADKLPLTVWWSPQHASVLSPSGRRTSLSGMIS